MYPPQLAGRLLVRSGELFGIAEGTTRVAISRMVATGELELDDGTYRLAGRLLERQRRQTASIRAEHRAWSGDWELAVVTAERRDASARAALRTAMRQLKLAELREGCWARPDNLDPGRSPSAAAVVAEQCHRFVGRPVDAADAAPLAAALWDLDAWAARAVELRGLLARDQGHLERGDTDRLASGFIAAAAVLRHLLADPELPDELVPAGWPGPALRADQEAFDAAFTATWRAWFRTQT